MPQPIALQPKQVPAALRGAYNGKRFYAEVTAEVTIPAHAGTWSGGSRDVWFARSFDGAVKLSDTLSAPWSESRAEQTIALTPDMVVVRHHQGGYPYLTIYVHPDAVAKLLPAPTHGELSDNERIVLMATRQYKSSYNGMDRYQMAQQDLARRSNSSFMSRVDWDNAKFSLINKGLLNKAGAITVAGKNASY